MGLQGASAFCLPAGRHVASVLHVGGKAPHVGGDPPHPPCICPPTRPFCGILWRPLHERRTHLACGKVASGGLCTKDASASPAERLPLAASARKTRPPRLRKGCLWRPLHEGRTRFARGRIALWRRGTEGRIAFMGGDPPAPHTPSLVSALHVGGFAPHVGGDILPLAWARRIRAKRSAALTRGRGPHPPCFCPPTRHLCTSAAFAWRCFGARLRVEFFGCGLAQRGAEGCVLCFRRERCGAGGGGDPPKTPFFKSQTAFPPARLFRCGGVRRSGIAGR